MPRQDRTVEGGAVAPALEVVALEALPPRPPAPGDDDLLRRAARASLTRARLTRARLTCAARARLSYPGALRQVMNPPDWRFQ